MSAYNVIFTDRDGWGASVEVEAQDSLAAVEIAARGIRATERGQKLSVIRDVEVEALD